MAETLGTLCDKLAIVELKRWHHDDVERRRDLGRQAARLCGEIDAFVAAALGGGVAAERLVVAAHKVHGGVAAARRVDAVGLGERVGALAQANCALWHQQEKVYAFEAVPVADKDQVVRRLAELNLERNACIEAIDRWLQQRIGERGGDGSEGDSRTAGASNRGGAVPRDPALPGVRHG